MTDLLHVEGLRAGYGPVEVLHGLDFTVQSGEVVVTGTVKDLVAGSGLVFEPLGERTLKGVPGSWPIYAVRDGEG